MPALRNHKRNRNSFDGVPILNTFQERLKEKQEINSYISSCFREAPARNIRRIDENIIGKARARVITKNTRVPLIEAAEIVARENKMTSCHPKNARLRMRFRLISRRLSRDECGNGGGQGGLFEKIILEIIPANQSRVNRDLIRAD